MYLWRAQLTWPDTVFTDNNNAFYFVEGHKFGRAMVPLTIISAIGIEDP